MAHPMGSLSPSVFSRASREAIDHGTPVIVNWMFVAFATCLPSTIGSRSSTDTVLLHGFPTSSSMFRNLIPLLASPTPDSARAM